MFEVIETEDTRFLVKSGVSAYSSKERIQFLPTVCPPVGSKGIGKTIVQRDDCPRLAERPDEGASAAEIARCMEEDFRETLAEAAEMALDEKQADENNT